MAEPTGVGLTDADGKGPHQRVARLVGPPWARRCRRFRRLDSLTRAAHGRLPGCSLRLDLAGVAAVVGRGLRLDPPDLAVGAAVADRLEPLGLPDLAGAAAVVDPREPLGLPLEALDLAAGAAVVGRRLRLDTLEPLDAPGLADGAAAADRGLRLDPLEPLDLAAGAAAAGRLEPLGLPELARAAAVSLALASSTARLATSPATTLAPRSAAPTSRAPETAKGSTTRLPRPLLAMAA